MKKPIIEKTIASVIAACVSGIILVAQADTRIADLYLDDATTPTSVTSDGEQSDGYYLQIAINQVSSRGRFVLQQDVSLGEQCDVILGTMESLSTITIDLNGHALVVNGQHLYETPDARRLMSICKLTFTDSVGDGTISGYPLICAKGCSITLTLPQTTVVSADTGYLGDYDPHESGQKGAVTINGGTYDGCVGGSNSSGTTLLTGGFFNKSKNSTITSYDATKSRYFDNGNGYWRVVPLDYAPSTITVPEVDDATATVYTHGAGSVWSQVPTIGSNKYVVDFGASVKVVYTAAADHVFAGGGTTYETTFVANAETITVSNVPDAPIELSGVTVNGLDVSALYGTGWTFANGVLSLTNEMAYTLSGANTAGAVRVEVTANANVTLDDLELVCDSATKGLLRFSGTDATLTLSGTSTVYTKNDTKNDSAAIYVAENSKLTVDGNGELVGGRSGSHCGRGVYVCSSAHLDWNGGTLRDYYFRKSDSTQEKGAGVCTQSGSVFNMNGGRLVGMYGYDGGAVYTQDGTVNIYGGDIAGNTAVFGAALYCRGTVNVYGGNITNNVVTGAGIVCVGSGTLSVYGGIASGNSGSHLCYKDTGTGRLYGAVGTDLASASPVSGKSVVQITDTLYAIGADITSANGQLTGGTFTFNPTDTEYAAAGLELADNREIVEQAGDPVTYQVRAILSVVTPQAVANASVKIYTNDVEVIGVEGAYTVARGATVKAVYTAQAGYAFADGKTTATATFVADAEEVSVPEDQLPKAPSEAKVRVTQASAEEFLAPSFAAAMSLATNNASLKLLKDCTDETPNAIYLDYSFDLDGDGHVLEARPCGGITAFAVISNRTVRMSNVTLDAQNVTGMLAIVSSGTLTLTNCCVTGFVTGGWSILASRDGNVSVCDSVFTGNDAGNGALMTFVSTTNATASVGCRVDGVVLTNNCCDAAIRSSNATDDPARHRFLAATITNSCNLSALSVFDGVTVLGKDFLNGKPAVVGRRAALAFADAAPAALDLYVLNAVSRDGEILVTNLYEVALDAAKVNVLNNGYTAWGADGNVYLASETNFLYAIEKGKKLGEGEGEGEGEDEGEGEGDGEKWCVFRSFDEAFAQAAEQEASTSVSLVHYRNVPNGTDIAVQRDDLTVGAGTNLVLRTVLRETLDGTNTTWNGSTDARVTASGTLTVAGKLTVENVTLGGKVVLAGGTLDIGAAYSTNGVPVVVELQNAPESEEVTAITSAVYTGAELLPHFSLSGDDRVFVVKANGLAVVKVADKVARVGTVDYDTFSAAVTAVADGGIVELIASSNAATAAHRDEVKFGSDVQVEAGKSFLVKSIRATLRDAQVVEVNEYPTVPVTLLLDGAKVTLGEGATMAFTNVALQGTLALAGSGILDLGNLTGPLYVRPTRPGLIATNVADAAQIQLGTGATGILSAQGTGIWWRDGSFSAKFVQTGNGVGRIDIDDYGVKTSVVVSDPVKNGRYDYHYVESAGQTGTDTNLAFGVVWCEMSTLEPSGAKITLPPKGLYPDGARYPQYLTANGGYVDFDLKDDGRWQTLPDLPTGEKDPKTHLSQATLAIRNYEATDVVIATFNLVATQEDAQTGMTEAYDNPDDDLREVLDILENINSGIAKLGVDVLFIGGILVEEFVGYNVASWVTAVKGLISSLCHICADVYVNDGSNDNHYYSRGKFDEACERALKNGWGVHVTRSAKYKPCTLKSSWGTSLAIDAAACPKTDFAGLASCIIGSVVPGDALEKAVISWISNVALANVEGFIEEEIDTRVPHGLMSDNSSQALLTIPSGVSVTLTGFDGGGLKKEELKVPLFDVSGNLYLDQSDGLSKPYNDLTGFKSVSSAHGVVWVKNTGRVYLNAKVTANADNAKNVYVENGGLVLVKSAGKDSRIGISGQTGHGAVFASTDQWTQGTTNDYAAVFSNDAKPSNCTLAINANGDIYWNLYVVLDLTDPPYYTDYNEALAAAANAVVARPNDAVKAVISDTDYAKLFTVGVAAGTGKYAGQWTLVADLTPTVSNAVQMALNTALPSLATTVTADAPSATIATQAGLYYGIPGAVEVSGLDAAVPSAWTLGTGSKAQTVSGAKPAGATDKAFYRLRVVILP